MKAKKLTLEFINNNFYYTEEKIFRKDGKNCSNFINGGYIAIKFKETKYLIHRILWMLYNQQEIPENYLIDHKDGNKLNNSKENLRLATSSENAQNSKLSSKNTSGIKGIHIHRNGKYIYYRVQISKMKKIIFKRFKYTLDGLEDAKSYLNANRKLLHGEFSSKG